MKSADGKYVFPTRKSNPSLVVFPLLFDPAHQTAWIYIMTNRPNGTLYVGVTNDLPRRIHEHRAGLTPGFTTKYGLKMLVYFEGFQLYTEAVSRETAMKNWPRAWKARRILATNPTWRDLYSDFAG